MREANKNDLPRGVESQCPMCRRLFKSDAACEHHKRYPKRGKPYCVDPNTLDDMYFSTSKFLPGVAIWRILAPGVDFGTRSG